MQNTPHTLIDVYHIDDGFFSLTTRTKEVMTVSTLERANNEGVQSPAGKEWKRSGRSPKEPRKAVFQDRRAVVNLEPISVPY